MLTIAHAGAERSDFMQVIDNAADAARFGFACRIYCQAIGLLHEHGLRLLVATTYGASGRAGQEQIGNLWLMTGTWRFGGVAGESWDR